MARPESTGDRMELLRHADEMAAGIHDIKMRDDRAAWDRAEIARSRYLAARKSDEAENVALRAENERLLARVATLEHMVRFPATEQGAAR